MTEPTRWRVTRTWYVEGVDTADAAIQATKQMSHVRTDAERMPLPDHEEETASAVSQGVPQDSGSPAMPRSFSDPVMARAAAYDMWARTPDRSARTAKARAAADARFERQVDPDGRMTPAARAQAAEAARKAFYTRMAVASREARRAKASARRSR